MMVGICLIRARWKRWDGFTRASEGELLKKAVGGEGEGRPIDVAAGLVFEKGKLLITQRRLNDHLGGFWEFPGGKVEKGETFQECLGRELREELGIEVEVGAEIEDITHSYPEKTVRLKFFKCR